MSARRSSPELPAGRTGRRVRPRAAALGAAALLLAAGGCASADAGAGPRRAGALEGEARSLDRREPAVPERDRVLHAYRAGATALRQGDFATAKAQFDDAISRIGGIVADDEAAAKARSLFAAESSKRFIGEPYERVMAYYYRGLLYWHDGEPDNARACFRSGQVIDSDPERRVFASDYVLLDYLEGLASAKLAADGDAAFARAQALRGENAPLPPYDPAANVLVFAEYGYGPRKYAAGEYGQLLKFHAPDSPSRSARLVLDDGRRIVPLPAYDDLGYQATTRGGRTMDHILDGKAVFKAGADAAGDVALAGAVIAGDTARRRERQGRDGDDAGLAAIGLGIAGIVGKIVAAATEPRADTRQWENLPQRLSFAALRLPPGEHRGRLEFLDAEGRVLERRTRDVIFAVAEGGRDTVVFLSELKA